MKILLRILILLFLFTACNENKTKSKKLNIQIDLGKKDTILNNKQYNGSLKYISYFDSIDPSIVTKRYILMYISTIQKDFTEIEDFEAVEHKGMIIDSSSVNFDFKFIENGNKKLSFIIKDIIAFKERGDTIRILTNTTSLEKMFFIKQRTNSNISNQYTCDIKFIKKYID